MIAQELMSIRRGMDGLVYTSLAVMMLVVTSQSAGTGHSWNYKGSHGVNHWSDDYSLCSSDNPRQSPIDIVIHDTVYSHDLDPISLESQPHPTYRIINNGHTVVAVLNGSIGVRGGDLGDKYTTHSFHFHWGSSDSDGSEHTVNGAAYPLELHIVNYDSAAYSALKDAAPMTDGLAVLGVFFQISVDDNPYLQPLLDALRLVKEPRGGAQLVSGLSLNELLPVNTAAYYRYLGSLTTPPCYESVVWTVFNVSNTISQTQLDGFRQVLTSSGDQVEALVDNFRPTQPLHERVVQRSFHLAGGEETQTAEGHQKPVHHWSYGGDEGPSHWHHQYPECSSDNPRQSPVDISLEDAVDGGEELGDIDFISHAEETDTITFMNNGHTVVGRLNSEVMMVGAGLDDVYRTHSFHFHWGSHNDIGSEHTVDGQAYPLELHIVHYDSERAPDLRAALTVDNGLAVLGVLFTVGDDNNTALHPIIEALRAVRIPKAGPYDIPHVDVRTLLPSGTEQYYRYKGSLTTPPCSQTVIWTVLANPQTISQSQMEEFRQLLATDDDKVDADEVGVRTLVDNFRPVQPLHERRISKSHALRPAGRAYDVVDSRGTGQVVAASIALLIISLSLGIKVIIFS